MHPRPDSDVGVSPRPRIGNKRTAKKTPVNFLTFAGHPYKIWFNPKTDKGVVRGRHPIRLSPTKKLINLSVGPNRPKEGG